MRDIGESIVLASQAKELYDAGYRPISNKHRILARLDCPNWKERLADRHVAGMKWVDHLGDTAAADHYRRCYTTDKFSADWEVYRWVKRVARAEGE